MSYRFDRIVAIQTAFESTEQLFITFLESIIKFIIEPFRDHYNKFHNTPKSQLDELNRVFILIENLCKYHQESKIKLSITLDGGSSSKYDDNNNIQSPPPSRKCTPSRAQPWVPSSQLSSAFQTCRTGSERKTIHVQVSRRWRPLLRFPREPTDRPQGRV